MAGAQPVTWADMEGWARLTGRNPDPAEIQALLEVTAVMGLPDKDDSREEK